MDNDDTDFADNQHSCYPPMEEIILSRNVLSKTNWLYRVDELRVHDIREMDVLLQLSNLYLDYQSRLISFLSIVQLRLSSEIPISVRY